MGTFITFLAVFFAIILVLIVLVQNSKGGGLSANFSSSNQIMGVRKTTDFLEKATWGLAGAIIILSILSAGFKTNSAKIPQSEVTAPASTPVSNTTSPDVSLPGSQTAAPAQQSTQSSSQPQQSQSTKPAFPAKPAK
ncbi:MAG: Preprotein translocase subunit SecG [Bacteroidetes bacterium]|jgi:preprotein translocase subunit SecG|nr:Preprotein translocase subunit SecG [Bacteroidota bacterium]